MMLSTEIAEAARYCLANGINFAVYAMPGSPDVTFIADDGTPWSGDESDMKGFFINSFMNRYPVPVLIRPQWDCRSVMGQNGEKPVKSTWKEKSTPREKYLRDIRNLTTTLKHDGGKTVISRVICGSASDIDWVKVADRYFAAYPSTFRFMYYTGQTGGWLGATPETILSRDTATSVITTMSLAGTRVRSNLPWDSKNIAEHNFVTDYIVNLFRAEGIIPEVHEAENVGYGEIEHLCHRITARYNGAILPLLHRLSPTPALAGVPLTAALDNIARYESHDRGCYGGYVGVNDESGLHTFVNLRSVRFDRDNYCVYAGGGITAASSPENEWAETEAKVARLMSIIQSESHE